MNKLKCWHQPWLPVSKSSTLLSEPTRSDLSPFSPQATLRFCAASDAALEALGQGAGGFLLIWYDKGAEVREAFVADIPSAIYALWEPGTKKIAQLEMMSAICISGKASLF